MGRAKQQREFNPNWKGGRSVASNGYVLIRVGTEHHLADVRGYAYEHRLVAEEKLGRRLRADEEVHHRDLNHSNNAPDNLEVLTKPDHAMEHRGYGSRLRVPGEANDDVACECGCGVAFARYDGLGRPRRFVSGHNESAPAPTRDAILSALADGPLARADLIAKSGRSTRAVAVKLARLAKSGVVYRVSRGVWARAAVGAP